MSWILHYWEYIAGCGIPIIFIIVASIGKKIVRGPGWEKADFYFGQDLTLASLPAALIYIVDLARILVHPVAGGHGDEFEKMVWTVGFLSIAFIIYLGQIALHQDWQARVGRPKTQFFYLGVVSNGLGLLLFLAFVVLIKGP